MDKARFYFTFGTSDTYPFKGGWVEVLATDYHNAVEIFRSHYPDRTPNIVNCSDIYTESAFLGSEMRHENLGHKCWKVLEAKLTLTDREKLKKVIEYCSNREDYYLKPLESGQLEVGSQGAFYASMMSGAFSEIRWLVETMLEE